MDDGKVWTGDLVIGTDNLILVLGRTLYSARRQEKKKSLKMGWDIFRWVLDAKVVGDVELNALMSHGRQTFVEPPRGG
jgi:hypothetical protein